MNINWERLRYALSIVDGIPDLEFDLRQIMKDPTHQNKFLTLEKATACGAIGCAVGWLSLHPEFEPISGRFSAEHANFIRDGEYMGGYMPAAGRMFGVDRDQAADLFGPPGISRYDRYDGWVHLSHKRLLRLRVVGFFKDHDQPVSSEYSVGLT